MKKNVLIIFTDQLRRDVLGCYGGREVETPNIDEIAQDGIALDRCYTASAVCTPSRGCFMTGRYPYTNGAYRNGKAVGMEEHGFAEAFRQAGYRTGYLGKWHLSQSAHLGELLENYNPLGFEDWQYQVEYAHCKSVNKVDGKAVPSPVVGDETNYTTDWLAAETISFLERRDQDQPFLFMVSIPDPHQPHTVRHPYDTMFDPLKVEIPDSFCEDTLPDWAEWDEWGRKHYFPKGLFDREGHLRRLKAQYLGSVKCIDDNVGKITAYLKENGLWENTIVVFTTDHGEYMGEHGLLEKNNLYESVYHLPMVMHIPGLEKTGQRNSTYMDMVDFGVTLAGLAGIDYPFPVQGRDKSDQLLEGKSDYPLELYIHPSDVQRAGIITEDYELAYVDKGWRGEQFHDHVLFDSHKDPQQIHNLFRDPAYRDVVEELTEKIRQHHAQVGTPREALPRALFAPYGTEEGDN